jgi:hypothetical protein
MSYRPDPEHELATVTPRPWHRRLRCWLGWHSLYVLDELCVRWQYEDIDGRPANPAVIRDIRAEMLQKLHYSLQPYLARVRRSCAYCGHSEEIHPDHLSWKDTRIAYSAYRRHEEAGRIPAENVKLTTELWLPVHEGKES